MGDYYSGSGGFPDEPEDGQQVIYSNSDEALDPDFDIPYETAAFTAFWVLLLIQACIGLVPLLRKQTFYLKRWPIYWMMLAYLLSTCICESLALVYSLSMRRNEMDYKVYLAYVWFWHTSSATFLVLLLALSSGYTITRTTLEGGHMPKVVLIPSILFIAGVASDFTFVYIKSTQPLSTAADRYNIVEMTPWESAVWVIGSIANIMCFVLAWVYVFDSTQLEIQDLDNAQEAFKAASQARGAVAQSNPRAGLLQGMPSSTAPNPNTEPQESVADRIEYTERKKLLTKFYYGVCFYLTASILVILLPAFFIDIVQQVLVVLQLVVKWIFTAVLMYIFRPAHEDLYLQIGASEHDAEEQGLAHLDTELALSDMQRGRDGGSARPPGLGGGLPVSTGAGPGGQGKPRFTINDED